MFPARSKLAVSTANPTFRWGDSGADGRTEGADERGCVPDETVREGEQTDRPFVSVVVPVYNDPEGVRDTLESLVAQTYPGDKHEVVVVDNNSTDDTRAVVRSFCDEYDRVRLEVERDVQSSYAARNRGIEAARGDVLAFVDADMTVDPDWLEGVVEELEDGAYLACDVELYSSSPETLVGKYNRLTGFPVQRYVEQQGYAPTCCLVVRRSVFDEIGEFDSRLISGGDSEFGNRVADSGRDLRFTDQVTMYHPTRDSLSSLLKKELRVGRGLCQRQQYYPERYGRPGIPPRPSGVKHTDGADASDPLSERVVFKVLSGVTTVTRAIGYFTEFGRHTLSNLLGRPGHVDSESS
ncbi:MAG: glycosyltransferase [Halobacteriota archaeon]